MPHFFLYDGTLGTSLGLLIHTEVHPLGQKGLQRQTPEDKQEDRRGEKSDMGEK